MSTAIKPSQIQWVQVYRVWFRNWVIFRRTWLISLFWVVLEPLFLLTAMGYGLGTYVKTMGGLPYVEFFFPGLLCVSSMMVSFFESTYGNFTKLTYSKVYTAQLLSPMTVPELVLGDIFWGASKGLFSGLAILFIGSLFGLVDTLWVFPIILILFVNSWIFSCLGMIVTGYVYNYDQIIYPTSGLLVPMSLFSGTYFPIGELNIFFKVIVYLSPLTYSVNLTRTLLVSGPEIGLLVDLGVLVVLAILMSRFAIRRMLRRLQL